MASGWVSGRQISPWRWLNQRLVVALNHRAAGLILRRRRSLFRARVFRARVDRARGSHHSARAKSFLNPAKCFRHGRQDDEAVAEWLKREELNRCTVIS